MQWPCRSPLGQIVLRGLGHVPRQFGCQLGERVYPRLVILDPREQGVDDLDRGEFAGTDRVGQGGRGGVGKVVAHAVSSRAC